MTAENLAEIAAKLNMSADQLFEKALVSLLRDKKREVMAARLEILARYGVLSSAELATKIRDGSVVEHPAWEDIITVENLEARLEQLDGYLAGLQDACCSD